MDSSHDAPEVEFVTNPKVSVTAVAVPSAIRKSGMSFHEIRVGSSADTATSGLYSKTRPMVEVLAWQPTQSRV